MKNVFEFNRRAASVDKILPCVEEPESEDVRDLKALKNRRVKMLKIAGGSRTEERRPHCWAAYVQVQLYKQILKCMSSIEACYVCMNAVDSMAWDA